MCGIAGHLSFLEPPTPHDGIERMIAALVHRGPDSNAFYRDSTIALGHARLSIVDLACGAQPMTNEDKSLWIVFNGEIFNYLELRSELEARGHQFSTRSDTEVILHLFEEKGEAVVESLNGQWAFAIWNRKSKSLFLSRDPIGILPLFYTRCGSAFLFASEIKALFEHPGVSRELDAVALDEVFTFWCAVAPRTAFRDVCEVPPGHSLVVEQGAIHVRRYWNLDYPPRAVSNEADAADELFSLLENSTRLRLRADVPVAAYLSGGLDSTVTAALALRSAPKLKTFSISFDDPDLDESRYQEEAVRFLGAEHQTVRCSAGDIQTWFPAMIRHAEKPVLRTAPAPLFLLSKLVRENGFRVVLTGEGADEMFGGYDLFKEAKVRRFWAAYPDSKLRPTLLRKLYPYLRNLQSQPDAYLRAFFHIQAGGPFFSHRPRWELTSRLKLFLSPQFRPRMETGNADDRLLQSLPKAFHSWDAFSQAQYLETTLLLPGYILSSQGDRMSMAHSVEARYPFLDPQVVAFASRLPAHLKMKVLNEKYLLKRAAKGLVPETIRMRPKQPYRAPEANCFFQPERAEYVDELLSGECIRRYGVFDPSPVERLVRKFETGQAIGVKDNMALTGILSTQMLIHLYARA